MTTPILPSRPQRLATAPAFDALFGALFGALPGALFGAFGLSVAIGLSGCADLSVPRALRIASAATSHTLCSSTFISGLPADQAWREEVRPEPGMGLIAWGMRYHVDGQRQEVNTTIAGFSHSRAVYRPGEGCLLLQPDTAVTATAAPPVQPQPPSVEPADTTQALPETPVAPADPALRAALAAAFADPDPAQPRQTKAVVVMHRGRLVAEAYAPGVGIHSALSGHSVSKSVVHALIGILVRQGRLDADAPAPVPEWQSAADPRRAITPEQLLRMDSGLPWDETAGGWDAATRMWFDEPDMAAFAAQGQPVAAPGTEWHYSNRGLILLSRLLRDASGGNAAGVRNFAQRELFGPAGMRRVEMTFDATGTPLGSSHFYATARDWARFGQLYLDDGMVGGRRVLPEGWVQRARTPTLGLGYGAGFWLNQTDAGNEFGGRWGMPGAPADAYFGRGHLGQFVVIVPSRQLVLVRLGLSHRPGGEVRSVGQLVAEVLAALPP